MEGPSTEAMLLRDTNPPAFITHPATYTKHHCTFPIVLVCYSQAVNIPILLPAYPPPYPQFHRPTRQQSYAPDKLSLCNPLVFPILPVAWTHPIISARTSAILPVVSFCSEDNPIGHWPPHRRPHENPPKSSLSECSCFLSPSSQGLRDIDNTQRSRQK